MTQEIIAGTALWFLLFVYIILGGTDFGYGILYLLSLFYKPLAGIQENVKAIMSPLWEANHVFLIVFYVGLITFFPAVPIFFSEALFVPIVLGQILFSLRGILFIAEYYIPPQKQDGLWRIISKFGFGITSLLLPYFLATYLSFSLYNTVIMQPSAPMVFSLAHILTNPIQLLLGMYAIVLALFSAILVVLWYEKFHHKVCPFTSLLKKIEHFLFALLFSGILALPLSLHTLTAIPLDRFLKFGLAPFGLGLFLCSWILFSKERLGFTIITSTLSLFLLFFGLFASMYPFLLVNLVTLEGGFVGSLMFGYLFNGLLLGAPLFILAPIILLYWFFMVKKA